MERDFRTQFIQRLNKEDLSLDNRLNIAYGALLSPEFVVNGKEQIVIDWFAHCLSDNFTQTKSLLKMLIKCLKCDCLQTFNNTVDASRLIEAVTNLNLNSKKKHSKHISKCILLLLKIPGFQRYCRFEIQPLCQSVVLVCESLEATTTIKGALDESTVSDDNSSVILVLEELCLCIHNIYNVTQQRSEMKQRFVKSLLPELLIVDPNIIVSKSFRNLIEELIIGEDIVLVCEAFKQETKKKIPPHLKALVELLTKNDGKSGLISITPWFFDEYVSTCLKNCAAELNHLSLFYILTSVIGFQLPLPYTTVTAANLSTSQQFDILAQLVTILLKHNVPSSSESQEGVLSHNLILILKNMLSGNHFLSSELLQAVANTLKLYPESVHSVFTHIMTCVIFVKKDGNILKTYDNLMMNIVKIFSDLNRLDKFFEMFFRGAVLISKKHNLLGLTSEMLLTKGFFSMLSEKLNSLTGNQMKSIISRLGNTFSKEFIAPLESTCLQDGSFCLLFKLIVKVLCHLLENSPLFIANRWNIVSEDIKNICLSVQRLGVSVLRGYQVKLGNKYELLLEFLQLVKVLANLELVANEYVISISDKRILPIIKSKDKLDVVHNLSKSHGFLIPQEWVCISEIVREAFDPQLTTAWQDLLLQKFMKLGDQGTLEHLVVDAVGSEWLWSTVAQVAPCVPLANLELYTDKLISSLNRPQQLTVLNNINVLSNRAFRVAMTFQSLNQLARSENSSLSGKLAKLFYIYPVMKFETEFSNEFTEQVNNITNALAESINRHCWEDHTPVVLEPDSKIYYSRVFGVLSLLHTHCLKTETKRIVCLMMIGLSCDLRCESDILLTILDYIMGCLDDTSPVVPNSLQLQVMARWLSLVVPSDYPHRQQLYTVAMGRVLQQMVVTEDVGELSTNEDLLCAALQALTVAHKSGRLKNNEEYIKLANKLITLASLLVSVKKPKPKTIRLFTVAVKANFLFFKEISTSLLPLLPKYLEILLDKLAGSDVVEPDTVQLIEVVLHPQTGVAQELVSRVCTTITQELCRTDVCPVLCYPSTVQAFLLALSSEEYQQVLTKICSHQQKDVSSLCELWTVVVGTQEGRDKARVRDKLLVQVLTLCHQLVQEDVSRFHSNLLGLLYSIVVHRSVALSSKLLDLLLVILGEAPTDSHPHLLQDSLSILSTLINVRAELVFDRIPVFLQRLRKFIRSLVLLSSVGETEWTYNTISSSSVNLVTRIIKTMTDHHAKHFARISPYLIADILQLLVSHSLESSVKEELQNCICSLLSICDHHSTQQLQNLLPVASVELYKVVATTFNKDFKYTGKV